MKPESKFWNELKTKLNLDWIKRVENSTEPGFPDVHYIHQGEGGWIELKVSQKFPNRIKFEPAQPIWLSKYWNAGGTCYVFLKVIEDNKIYIWPGFRSYDLNQNGGTHAVKPMLVISMTNLGWENLLDIFRLVIPQRLRQQNPLPVSI